MDVSLYFHVPFCKKKCPYCHFYVIPNQARYKELLKEGFALEWELQKGLLQDARIVSVYFGGGTPTLLDAEDIATALQRIGHLAPDCEITIEANPEDASLVLFQKLAHCGINRVSFGVQSLDDRSLSVLGRAHSATKAKSALFAAFNAGIENISIDLMYDLPDQTESSWHYTLDQLKDLPIQHASLYNLTIEPHTSFYKRKNELQLPKPETSVRLLNKAIDTFASLGMERYEISAFAKPGHASRHNLGYWTFRPFLGFGPSAFSYWNRERFRNVANLQRYVKALRENRSPVDFRETLAYPYNLQEQIAVGLRLTEGCEIPDNTTEETRKVIFKLQESGLILENKKIIRLTEKGKLFYDSVASEII